jgi:hypothetical protein
MSVPSLEKIPILFPLHERTGEGVMLQRPPGA